MKKMMYIITLIFVLGFNNPVASQNENLPDITALEWNNSGNQLAIGYGGGKITILNVTTNLDTNIGEISTGNILSIAWHPTNNNLIIVGMSQSPYWRIYDVNTNQLLYYQEVGSTSVSDVSWNVDGTLIASAANWVSDNTETPRVDIWDATNCNLAPYEYNGYFITQCQLIISFEHRGYINDVRWHPTDPFKLVSATDQEITRFWDVNLNDEYRPSIFNYNGASNAVWSHDGSQIAISQGGENSCSVGLWNVNEVTENPFHKFEIECYINIAWKLDGSLAISEESNVNITDIEAREIFETIELISQGELRFINDIDWSVNGDLAIGGTNDALLYFKPNTYYIVDEASDLATFIEMANANTSMNIFDVRGDFDLTEALPQITGDITIIGNGASITMTGEAQIFNVVADGSLTLKNITVSGGNSVQGGAIFNAGTLVLEDAVLENNSADEGGAIYNAGSLTMTGGALQNNSAEILGGAIYNAGPTLDLNGVTIENNDAPDGSAVYQAPIPTPTP